MPSPLIPYLLRNYAEVKGQYPSEGRRKWRLRVVDQFWTAVRGGSALHPLSDDVFPEPTLGAERFDSDSDPLDGVTRDVPEVGLIVRTDFSDEVSWATFYTRLQDGEKEFISLAGSGDHADGDLSEQPLRPDDQQDEDSSDSDDEDEGVPPAIFHIINPSSPQDRELLAGISNLAVLRLFNDVDVRPSPALPQGTKRINPPNRLVDCHGWQEFYQGKNVWVYDAKSNIDQSMRVVSQSGDMYGTATGDSWRARVSHVCELQVNMSSGAIRIDFGGLDRWDFGERKRNMTEAEKF